MLDVRLGYASICKRVAGHTHWRSFFGAAAFLVVLVPFVFLLVFLRFFVWLVLCLGFCARLFFPPGMTSYDLTPRVLKLLQPQLHMQ